MFLPCVQLGGGVDLVEGLSMSHGLRKLLGISLTTVFTSLQLTVHPMKFIVPRQSHNVYFTVVTDIIIA